MNFNFTAKDMKRFEEKHPDAYNFLLKRSLRNEYLYLWDNQYILNDWQKYRLIELENVLYA